MVKMLVKQLFKMVVNVEKVQKMVENGDFSKFVKNREMLKNVGENIKKFCTDLLLYPGYLKYYFNPKFYHIFCPLY